AEFTGGSETFQPQRREERKGLPWRGFALFAFSGPGNLGEGEQSVVLIDRKLPSTEVFLSFDLTDFDEIQLYQHS
ncbi:MAG: hypothetical protein U0176_26460, partial [Bacteroidia bacterium]